MASRITEAGLTTTTRGYDFLFIQDQLAKEMVFHRSRAYYDVSGLNALFPRLDSVIGHIKAIDHKQQPAKDPRSGGYTAGTGNFRIYMSGKAPLLDLRTTVHELVHVLDHKNGWYLPRSAGGESPETIAYGLEYILEAARSYLAPIDNWILDNEPLSRIVAGWNRAWAEFDKLIGGKGPRVEWDTGSRPLRDTDIRAVRNLLHVDFSATALKSAYEKKLTDYGYTITPTTLRIPGGLNPEFQ